MLRKVAFPFVLATALVIALTACSSAAPAPAAPTQAPAKAAEPTKAPAAPTSAPAAAATKPTAAPAAAKPANYPTKPLKMIVAWAAGNAVDTAARILAAQLEKEVGQAVQVVNMDGASTQVGLTALINSPPDGYTFMYITVPTSVNVYMDPARKANFSSKDFIAGPQVVSDPLCVVVRADSKWKTIQELAADIKANPGKILAGDAGILTVTHMEELQFEKELGARMNQVHFATGAVAVTELLGNHVDVVFTATGSARPAVEAGQTRMLAVATEQRAKFYPQVPTFKEAGFNVIVPNLHGIVTPKGTPPEITKYLEEAVLRTARHPDYLAKTDQAKYEVITTSGEQFMKKIQSLETMYTDLSKLVPK